MDERRLQREDRETADDGGGAERRHRAGRERRTASGGRSEQERERRPPEQRLQRPRRRRRGRRGTAPNEARPHAAANGTAATSAQNAAVWCARGVGEGAEATRAASSRRRPTRLNLRRRSGRSCAVTLRASAATRRRLHGRRNADVARPLRLPARHARRQADLRRPVPERQPEVPRERADARARRHRRAHARPRRPRRRHGLDRLAASARRSSRRSSSKSWLGKQGADGRRAARHQQGRLAGDRRDPLHADERVPLVELGRGRVPRRGVRARDPARERDDRSTSPATRASSATCS